MGYHLPPFRHEDIIRSKALVAVVNLHEVGHVGAFRPALLEALVVLPPSTSKGGCDTGDTGRESQESLNSQEPRTSVWDDSCLSIYIYMFLYVFIYLFIYLFILYHWISFIIGMTVRPREEPKTLTLIG